MRVLHPQHMALLSGLRVLALALGLAGCGAGGTDPVPHGEPWFALRGRWAGPGPIRVQLVPDDGPVGEEELGEAFTTAADAWNEVGGPGFVLARTPESADVTVTWERGAHGRCLPFGADESRAHTGPVESGTWIHLDAGRSYGPEDLPLARVILHELGHVLGLDHVDDPTSILHVHPTVDAPGFLDRAAVHSLYGGGDPGPGDLALSVGEGSAEVHWLRGVAPVGKVDWAVFDVNGDGVDELFLWRLDPEGSGRVQVMSFGPGPRPRETYLLEGLALPGAPLHLVEEGGTRFVVQLRGAAEPLVRTFLGNGRARPWPGETSLPFDPRALPAPPKEGDLEGDGVQDHVRRR